MRRELAWLQRGAKARTSKPKARTEAVRELREAEPGPGEDVDLLGFASARLGKTVLEAHDVSLSRGSRVVLDRVSWAVGPGDRIGIVGLNGAGKTSLVRLLLGDLRPDTGKVTRGVTVRPALLSQHLEELDPARRVLESVEDVATRVQLARGRELSASQLCERLGFGKDRQWTPVGDLSGGERRRLQLTRLLMGEPNVLVLDEPTNDLDIETLTGLEDLLDSFAGTLIVISHDRYFIERTCDRIVGLLGDGLVRDLPRGVEEYLQLRRDAVSSAADPAGGPGSQEERPRPVSTAAAQRTARKEMARLERAIAKAEAEERRLHELLADHATDHEKVAALDASLREVSARRSEAEHAWLAAAERAER